MLVQPVDNVGIELLTIIEYNEPVGPYSEHDNDERSADQNFSHVSLTRVTFASILIRV